MLGAVWLMRLLPGGCRPEPVLRAALRRLVGLLRDGAVNYFYALDQLKVSEMQQLSNDCRTGMLAIRELKQQLDRLAGPVLPAAPLVPLHRRFCPRFVAGWLLVQGMRQDCTVQHIRNDLAVQVGTVCVFGFGACECMRVGVWVGGGGDNEPRAVPGGVCGPGRAAAVTGWGIRAAAPLCGGCLVPRSFAACGRAPSAAAGSAVPPPPTTTTTHTHTIITKSLS
jgi:hypothetical protein